MADTPDTTEGEPAEQRLDAPTMLRAQYRDASNLNARIGLHERFSTNPVPWQRWVFDQLRVPAHASVLELGCGPADLWRHNLDRIPAGWHVTLSDASPGMLDAARAALGPHASRFYFREVDAQAIPYANGAFDDVIANHMLYHVPDRPRALADIRRVLKPGGALYAAANGAGHMGELGTLLEAVNPELGVLWSKLIVRASGAFTLENGAEQLRAFFSPVRLRRRENLLRVSEAEPLLDYLASMRIGRHLAPYREAIAERVERAIAEQGAFEIHTVSGIFQALGPA